MKGRLARHIPISLVDVSLSGGLVRVDDGLYPGTSGELSVSLFGKAYRDRVEVVRCTMLDGATHAYTLGVEFRWGNRLGHASLRGVVPSPARFGHRPTPSRPPC